MLSVPRGVKAGSGNRRLPEDPFPDGGGDEVLGEGPIERSRFRVLPRPAPRSWCRARCGRETRPGNRLRDPSHLDIRMPAATVRVIGTLQRVQHGREARLERREMCLPFISSARFDDVAGPPTKAIPPGALIL